MIPTRPSALSTSAARTVAAEQTHDGRSNRSIPIRPCLQHLQHIQASAGYQTHQSSPAMRPFGFGDPAFLLFLRAWPLPPQSSSSSKPSMGISRVLLLPDTPFAAGPLPRRPTRGTATDGKSSAPRSSRRVRGGARACSCSAVCSRANGECQTANRQDVAAVCEMRRVRIQPQVGQFGSFCIGRYCEARLGRQDMVSTKLGVHRHSQIKKTRDSLLLELSYY
jgi:hypothetical protein